LWWRSVQTTLSSLGGKGSLFIPQQHPTAPCFPVLRRENGKLGEAGGSFPTQKKLDTGALLYRADWLAQRNFISRKKSFLSYVGFNNELEAESVLRKMKVQMLGWVECQPLDVIMAGSMKGQAVQTPQHLQRVAQQLMATQKARHSASKYDFVKV